MYRRLKAPLNVQIELTHICNNRCFHCYNFWREDGREHLENQTLSREHLTRIIEVLANYDILQITFTGGEPLLFPDLVLAGVRSCVSAGIQVGVNSNLTKLDELQALTLKSLGLSNFLTSLAGPNCDVHDSIVGRHGAFEETVRGIRVAKDAGIGVSVNMVVTTKNQNVVIETGAFLATLGVDAFSVTKATAPCSSVLFREDFQVNKETIQRNLGELLELKQQYGFRVDVLEHYPHCLIGDLERFALFARRRCTAGVIGCTIGTNGQMRPCSHSWHEYGSVFEEGGFESAWSSMEQWRDGSLLPTTCRSCAHVRTCSGGCRVDAATLHGNLAAMETYATREVDVIKPLPHRKLPAVPPRMRIGSFLKFREESFGACVSKSGGQHAFVSADGAEMLKLLRSEASFTLEDICIRFSVNEDSATQFLQQMLFRGIVEGA